MLPTTIITLACLWLCPTDPWIQINLWDSHPPQPIEVKVGPKAGPNLRPATVSQSSPSPSSSSGVEQWRTLITIHFPAGEVERALCVISGESGGDASADNPRSTARGLWQFLRSTWDEMVPIEVTGGSYDSGAVLDPVASTRAAAWLWAELGWSQWSAARRC